MTTIEKIGLCLGGGVSLMILGLIFFSTNGVMDYRALKKEEARIIVRARQEALENKTIEKEINRLKHDLEYIRHRARHDHGMAAPDELIFKQPSNAQAPHMPVPDESNSRGSHSKEPGSKKSNSKASDQKDLLP